MKRVTLKGLNRYAEDHNKQNSGDNWTWEDVIFYWAECGNMNNINDDLDHMSKKETLIVLDWAVRCRLYWKASNSSYCQIYEKIYRAAKDSLMERL